MNRAKIFVFIVLIPFIICVESEKSDKNAIKIPKPQGNEQHHFPQEFFKFFQIAEDILGELSNSSQCKKDGEVVVQAFQNGQKWALEMFDAWSKFPSGLLYGNHYDMGNYDECVDIRQKAENIFGQYCLAEIKMQQETSAQVPNTNFQKKNRQDFDSTIHWSVCVPSSCTTNETKLILQKIFNFITPTKLNITLEEKKCHVNSFEPMSHLEIIYSASVLLFVFFTIVATTIHYFDKELEAKNLFKDILFCFSLIRNVKKFLSTKSTSMNLECICGIRFLSMNFIIVGHTFLFLVGGPVQNTSFYEAESHNFLNAIFVNSPLLVDTFLLLSGFLMSYMLLAEIKKRKGKINVLVLYLARYFRLTPSYLVVLGFYCTFLYRTGSGPLWDSRIKLETERCQKSFWTNLFYINNYFNTDSLCMFQSWYLAVDYHLFIVAPLFIFLLWKWAQFGKFLLGFTIIGSMIVPFVITLKEKLDPSLMIFAPEVSDVTLNSYYTTAYIKTHMRASSYLIGLFFGYILYQLQTEGTKIPKIIQFFGWLLSATCGIVAMFSIVIFYDPKYDYDHLEAATYSSLHRAAWCISIGWILVICITKNSPVVNGFLSWGPFIVLSRLTYCAYLANGFVELYSFANIRSGNYMSKFELATKGVAHSVFTFVIAFVLCIFFESPIHALEKILLKKY